MAELIFHNVIQVYDFAKGNTLASIQSGENKFKMTLGRPQAGNLQLHNIQFCPPSAAAAAREACVHRRSCQVAWQAQGQLICLPALIPHFRYQYPHEELKCSDCKVFAGQCLQTLNYTTRKSYALLLKGTKLPIPSVNIKTFQ